METSAKKASTLLVTLAVGKTYIDHWRDYCESNWRQYANAHGYDLMCIDRPLDESSRARQRSVSWQKCLVLGQRYSREYERIVWIDSDILISPSAPPVDAHVPLDKVGAVRAYSTPTRELFLEAYTRLIECDESRGVSVVRETTPREYHSNFGLPSADHDDVVQGGVLVLSPRHHRELLEKVYLTYEDKGSSQWHYEMRPLSHELQNAGVVYWIDHRFNQGWLSYQVMHYPFLSNGSPTNEIGRRVKNRLLKRLGLRTLDERIQRACATTAFLNSYFLHFAGSLGDMRLVDQQVRTWNEIPHPARSRRAVPEAKAAPRAAVGQPHRVERTG